MMASVAVFGKLCNPGTMTGRQRALHTIESALCQFTPEIRDEMARSVVGLGAIFKRPAQPGADVAAVWEQLEGGVVDLISTSVTALLSKSGRERWANGLVSDGAVFCPDLCARVRKFSR